MQRCASRGADDASIVVMSAEAAITARFSSPSASDHHFVFPLNNSSLPSLIERLLEAKTSINEHLTKAVEEERTAAGDGNGSTAVDSQPAKKLKT